MSKRLQIVLNQEASQIIEAVCTEANKDFVLGHINYSDVINELVVCGKVDVKQLQIKHTNVRKSLRLLSSQKDIDIDTVIKTLTELRVKTGKRPSRNQVEQEVV